MVYAGSGDDWVDGGAGNDFRYGQGGDDTIAGGAGADELAGQFGDDVITGSAFSDVVFGGDGSDFLNGGFGHDRLNGGAGADRFFHAGVAGDGSDWIQDYAHAQGDVLLYDGSATASDFLVNFVETDGAGLAEFAEAFVFYKPTGQIQRALVDGEAKGEINLRLDGQGFDLLT